MRTVAAFLLLASSAFAFEQPKQPKLDWHPTPEPTVTTPNESQRQQYLNRVMYERQQAADAAALQAEKQDAIDFRYGR